MGRQRITLANNAIIRSKPSAVKIPSIATRTLAVVASLWSSSSSSPFSASLIQHSSSSQHQWRYGRQYQKESVHKWNNLYPFSLLQNPFPCVTAFHPETLTGISRKGRHLQELTNHHRQQQQQQCHQKLSNNFDRWYQKSSKRFLTIVKASEDIESSTASPSVSAQTAVSSDTVESTRHLPRLFIEPPSPVSMDASRNSDVDTNRTPVVSMQKKSLIPLTPDQEHYLLDVVRITNPKRWGGGRNGARNGADYTGCVRIFNGADGEWLARVVEDPSDATVGGNQPKKQRRMRGGKNQKQGKLFSGTILECLELLRPQKNQPEDQSCAYLRLYLGYIKDKQRRRWVFEKATELGIDSITILETDFSSSNKNLGDKDSYKKKGLRWEDDREKHKLHVIEAAEQCERLTVPSVEAEVGSVDAISEKIPLVSEYSNNNDNEILEEHLWLVCRERSESSPPIISVLEDCLSKSNSDGSCSRQKTGSKTIHVLVGPEGGWSPRELELFSSLKHVRFVSLGPSVLRAETAAITAIASVQMHRETLR